MENQYNVGSIFAAYASFTAFLTLVKQFYHQFVPDQIREYIDEKVKEWFSKKTILDPKLFTLVVHQSYQEPYGYSNHNHVYDACQVYLADKLRSLSTRLEGFCGEREDPVEYQLSQGEEYVEFVEIDKTDPKKVKLQWKFFCKNDKGEEVDNGSFKSFQVSVDLKHKDQLLDYYIPSVVVKNHNKLLEMKKDIYLYTYNSLSSNHWNEVSFNHPFTFDALALDPDLKKSIVDDLERFIRRKDFYKKIGKAWKRGYLLYGPPGTGKSSLIAAIANHLKFNVYDLQLGGIERDSVFRNLMMSISNKSILVIEDIDCASGLSRKNVVLPRSSGGYGSGDDDDNNNIQETPPVQNDNLELSLSGLLNFIDGLWSSCGDERIIILTTNYKERLDPALLRPGRMDMHIHMSYLRMPAFRILASNYLDLLEHPLFQEIEELLGKTDVSPAEVAEQLIRSEDPDVALSGVVDMLKQNKKKVRKMKKEEKNDDDDDNSKSSSESLAKKPKNGGECASHTQLTEEALD